MIVIDASVLIHAVVETDQTPATLAARRKDPDWNAPRLWMSEFRSILRTYLVTERMTEDEALQAMTIARRFLARSTGRIADSHVLRLAASSGCSAYDAEYVALAESMQVPLLTYDRRRIGLFPASAMTPDRFAAARAAEVAAEVAAE